MRLRVEDVSSTLRVRAPLVNHALLTINGMRKSPVQVFFTTGDIKTFGLEKDAIECGLMTLSKEKDRTITKGIMST